MSTKKENVFVINSEYLKVINKPIFIKKLKINRDNFVNLELKFSIINFLEIKKSLTALIKRGIKNQGLL